MVKIIGVIMIIFATTCIGFELSSKMLRRINTLKSVCFVLREMASQIRFGQDVLYDVIGRTKEKTEGCITNWLNSLMLEIEISVKTLDNIWSDSCIVLKDAGLLMEDILQLEKIGGYITGENLERIEDVFLQQEEIMNQKINILYDEYRNKSKVYKSLGLLCGIFICIVII